MQITCATASAVIPDTINGFLQNEHLLSEQVLILPRANTQVKVDKRERILDAAERVLRAKGLAGATTRAITSEAGCAEGTLYIYFKGRAELFLALFERHLRAAFPERRLLNQKESVAPHAVLLDIGLHFLRFHREVGGLLAGLFAEPALLKKYRELILSRTLDAPRAVPALVPAYGPGAPACPPRQSAGAARVRACRRGARHSVRAWSRSCSSTRRPWRC